jgi:hypothetical protein
MPEQEPKPPGDSADGPARENSLADDVRTTNPDEIFADWSEMRLGRAALYLAALLAAAVVLVLVLILIGIL